MKTVSMRGKLPAFQSTTFPDGPYDAGRTRRSMTRQPEDGAIESTGNEPANLEQSLQELGEIVGSLEEGRLGLEDSLRQFERGIGLLRSAYRMLDVAERRVEQLVGADAEGKPQFRPFEHLPS